MFLTIFNIYIFIFIAFKRVIELFGVRANLTIGPPRRNSIVKIGKTGPKSNYGGEYFATPYFRSLFTFRDQVGKMVSLQFTFDLKI